MSGANSPDTPTGPCTDHKDRRKGGRKLRLLWSSVEAAGRSWPVRLAEG
jgi:hypothetical protein